MARHSTRTVTPSSDLPGPHLQTERARNRLNALVLVLPGQWLGLMAVFWLRFLPPFRPYDFHTSAPPAWAFGVCLATCLVPLILPTGYFRAKAFERGRFYPRLGIRLFRYVAPDGDGINRLLRSIDPSYRAIRSRVALREHLDGSYVNERWHLTFFLMGAFTQVFAAASGLWFWATLLTIANTLFNLYPVMHQRYKRARARRALRAHLTDPHPYR